MVHHYTIEYFAYCGTSVHIRVDFLASIICKCGGSTVLKESKSSDLVRPNPIAPVHHVAAI